MAVSGSWDFTLTRNQIISAALRKLGVLAQGQTATNNQISEGAQALNIMVKRWTAEGIYLWAVDHITQSLSDSSTVLGTDSVDWECIRNHTASANDKPITGANYMSYWKQLSTTSAGAWVLSSSYTSICNYSLNSKYVGIDKAIVREDTSDTALQIITREEYAELTNKTSEGTPTMIYFDRQTTPQIFLYPYPDSSSDYVIELWLYTFFQDFDASGDTPDFLAEWFEALVYGLAVRLAPEYSIGGQSLRELMAFAEDAKYAAKGLSEMGDLQLMPDIETQ